MHSLSALILVCIFSLSLCYPIPVLEPETRIPDAVLKFAVRSIRTHLSLDDSWDFDRVIDGKVETSTLKSTRLELRSIEREVYDYSTQQNVKRRSLENVPIEVNQRVDTETTMTLELRSEDPASTAAPLVVQVGVSQDVNNIPSLTRLLIPQPVSFTPAPTRMRVMCVNLWNYNFWIHRKALLLREIQRANPDVIGFQEVRVARDSRLKMNARARSQVVALSEMLRGWQFVWVPAMSFTEGGVEFHAEGVAVFSRLPIVGTSFVRLSRNVHDSGDFHQRICLQASIALSAERTVNVFVTHLSLSQEARLRTLPEIQQFVDSFPKQPAVLMGDFNGEVAISDFGNTSMVLQDAWLYSQHKYFGHDQNVPLPSKSCPAQASAAASTSFDVVVESSGNIAMASHSADLTPIENQPANHEGQIRISSPSTSTPVLQDVHSANVPIERATLNADVQPLTGPTPSLNIDTNQHLTCQPNVDASLDFTFSAWRPRSRIDYIFTRHLNVLESRLIGVDSTLVDDLVVKGLSGFESGGGVDLDGRMYASDHRLLLSEVELQ